MHRFYQEQYQLDGGKQNRYVTGSDAVGLTMGHYDTKSLPIYQYLHGRDAPNYVIADHFFQAAFGGSFLNHQYLVAARAPIDTSARPRRCRRRSALDRRRERLPQRQLPAVQPADAGQDGAAHPGLRAGRRTRTWPAVTSRSTPCSRRTRRLGSGHQTAAHRRHEVPEHRRPAERPRACRWNWYAGGWNDAAAGHPGPLFQYHHQPFNYFADYAPGKPGRDAPQDETDFIAAAQNGTLPTVSFVKPYGAENEHPGYASEPDGSDHLVDLLKTILAGPQAKDTLVVVTYDEFGGQWDHVSPPGQGSATKGVHDELGPGHPDPGPAGERVVRPVRGGPHGLRHHLDPGHHRARPGLGAVEPA